MSNSLQTGAFLQNQIFYNLMGGDEQISVLQMPVSNETLLRQVAVHHHVLKPTLCMQYRRNISLRFSCNPEAFASGLQENLEEMFLTSVGTASNKQMAIADVMKNCL